MIRNNLALYLGSRSLAALSNLLAVAVFTRLSGPEVYGHYVVAFAAAMVIGGFSVQWIRYAFFNHYRTDEDRDFFASFVALILVSMLITAVIASIAFALDGVAFSFAAGALLIGLSVALFDVVTEVCRTRLQAGRVALGVTLKAILFLGLGTAALLIEPSALSLAIGVALAHLLASIPAALSLRRLVAGRPTWREIRKLVGFGWPLMLSFGIGAFAQGVDRFVLAHVDGAAATGAYGALSDVVRASFTILGESISMAMIPLAKRQFSGGLREDARHTLELAFRMFLVVGMFLTAAALVFAPTLLPIVFPASFLTDADRLLPVILLASFALVMRNVYLAQTIYFTRTSQLELVSALILTVVNLGLCLVLVPRYGALGAALGFLGGQIVSGAFFLLAGRSDFPMPTPWRPVLVVGLVGAGLVLAGRAIGGVGLPLAATLPAQAALLLVAFAGTAIAIGLRPGAWAEGVSQPAEAALKPAATSISGSRSGTW